MSNAIVFDWDGTIVSCEEKIDLAITKLCKQFPAIAKPYKDSVAKKTFSSGWVRKGFTASLPEDYFTYHFGIVAELIAKAKSLVIDSAWSVILSTFTESYLEVNSRILIDLGKLYQLAEHVNLYIVSNSEIKNIKAEAKSLGIKCGVITFVGNTKKYNVAGVESSVIGISANRPNYQATLSRLQKKHENIIVVGDNFSLDLVAPIAMGISVAYVPNLLSPKIIIRYVKKNCIPHGTINDILDILINKKGSLS